MSASHTPNVTMRQPVPFVTVLIIILLAACGGPTPGSTPSPIPSITTFELSQISTKVETTPSTTPSLAPTKTATSVPATITPAPAMRICSPLADVPIEELNELIVNPFQPPGWGSDDPHQGADFAILSPLNQIALAGNPIHAVLDGQVVAVMKERFPYGNAILVETALDTLPPDLITQLELPTPAPTLSPHPSLTCPQTGTFPILDPGHGSLYLLYAHMQEPPALVVGDSVLCGDRLGTIGDSGNALNPHLHLETRVGPAGARFPSLAHYETRAKAEEMEAYCLWRVSGVFQLVNPSLIFGQLP